VCVCVCMCVCICIYVYIHVYTSIYMNIYILRHIYMNINRCIYIYICMHVWIYTCVHSHVDTNFVGRSCNVFGELGSTFFSSQPVTLAFHSWEFKLVCRFCFAPSKTDLCYATLSLFCAVSLATENMHTIFYASHSIGHFRLTLSRTRLHECALSLSLVHYFLSYTIFLSYQQTHFLSPSCFRLHLRALFPSHPPVLQVSGSYWLMLLLLLHKK